MKDYFLASLRSGHLFLTNDLKSSIRMNIYLYLNWHGKCISSSVKLRCWKILSQTWEIMTLQKIYDFVNKSCKSQIYWAFREWKGGRNVKGKKECFTGFWFFFRCFPRDVSRQTWTLIHLRLQRSYYLS